MTPLWGKDDRAGIYLPVRKVQAAESRVPGVSPGQARGNSGLASTEPQKLCRFFYPKGRRKRVKRGNPPRCNLRTGRLRRFPKSQGQRASDRWSSKNRTWLTLSQSTKELIERWAFLLGIT